MVEIYGDREGLIEIKVLPQSALSLRHPTDNMGRPALLLFQGKVLHNSEDSKDVLLKYLASSIKVIDAVISFSEFHCQKFFILFCLAKFFDLDEFCLLVLLEKVDFDF